MKVGILIYPNCTLWSASGPLELLLRANRAQDYFSPGKKHALEFEPEFVATSSGEVRTFYDYPIECKANIHNNKQYELVIVPGFDQNIKSMNLQDDDISKWIRDQYQGGAKIASLCTGSFLLAKSGILKNKAATTHWLVADAFCEMFPEVEFSSDKIIIDHGDIFMSGGATSFQNLIIYLIEKFMGRKIALGVSKIYLIDLQKDCQSSYSILSFYKEHNDSEILKAQRIIEKNVKEKISLEQIAEKLSMSERNFIRRFKKATGDTPFHYIQKVKVEEAKRILESERKSIQEVVYEVGYEDINSFRKLFVKLTGVSPVDYKKRYNRSCI